MEDVRLSLSKNKGFPCCLFCYTGSPAFWSARQMWQTWQTWFPQSLSTCAIWRLSYWYILLIWKELERQERRATASHRASSAFLFKSLAEGQRWNWVVFAESKRQYKAKLVSLKPLTNKGLIFVQLILGCRSFRYFMDPHIVAHKQIIPGSAHMVWVKIKIPRTLGLNMTCLAFWVSKLDSYSSHGQNLGS